jgi:hypothetical protein
MDACRCGVEDFKRSSEAWRTRAESAAALRSDFAELLAEDADLAAAGPAHAAADGAHAAGVAARGEEEGDAPMAGERKKRRKALQRAAEAALQLGAPDGEAEEEASGARKMKKKKRREGAQDPAAGSMQGEAGAAQLAEKRKRKRSAAAAEGQADGKKKHQVVKGGLAAAQPGSDALGLLLTGTAGLVGEAGSKKLKRKKKVHAG